MLGAVNAAVPNADSFYAKHIHPILDANCVGMPWRQQDQGGLRLDTYETLMKGGKDGPVILPRHADNSLLIQRVTLPANNQHFMPAEGRPPLKPDQIIWIRAWIRAGRVAGCEHRCRRFDAGRGKGSTHPAGWGLQQGDG